MSQESLLMSLIGGALLVFLGARWIARMPVEPDPWDSQTEEEESDDPESEVCTKCLAPVADPSQHYCAECGNAIGKYTPYVPFVNIRFNYSLFATLWHRLRNPEAPLLGKAVAVLAVLLTTPLMLFVGLPFLIYGRLTRKPGEQA